MQKRIFKKQKTFLEKEKDLFKSKNAKKAFLKAKKHF